MIKYRLLCFWAAAAITTVSIGLAQTPPAEPAPAPADTTPVSAVAGSGSVPAGPATPKTAQRFTTSVKSAQQQTDPASVAESPAHIAIVRLPAAAESEVIRQVVELLEKQGIAKEVQTDAPTKTMSPGLSARIAATPDVKTEEVLGLVKSLQGHGIVSMSFAKPSDNRNVVTVQAPADTPWPVIDNIRTVVNAKKSFSVDVQIATPNQSPETVRGGSYNARGTSRYGYPARPGHTPSPTEQTTSRTSVQSTQKTNRVEPSQAAVLKVLKEKPGIIVKMGDNDRLVSVVQDNNRSRVIATVLGLTKDRKDIVLLSNEEGLIVQTPADFTIAVDVTQKVLDSLSLRNHEYSSKVAKPVVENNSAPMPKSVEGVPEVQVTQLFRLKFADATALSESVSQLFDKSFGIVPDVRTNSVVVRGTPPQLREMEALVEALDSQQLPRPVAQAFRPANPNEPLRQVVGSLDSFFIPVNPPVADPVRTRAQVEQLEKSARAAAETLRTLKAQETAKGAKVPEEEDKRKAVLRDAVRQTFLARQNLQRAELAEFATRLNRIRQTIEMREKIADKIIDRRVEELLDPNLKWDNNSSTEPQKTVVRNQSVVRQQNENKQLQPPSKQNSAPIGNQTVVVSQTSEGTVILRNAEKFREVLATHAERVAQIQATIEAWTARRENSDDPTEADRVLKVQHEQLARVEADQKFALKEYETQIRLLESEVETVILVLETAKQELVRAQKLFGTAAVSSHELDKRKREVTAAEQRLEKARILLKLYRDAAEGI